MKQPLIRLILATGVVIHLSVAQAAQFENWKKAVASVLGTTSAKAAKRPDGGGDVYFSRNKSNQVEKLAFIEKGLYPPNCTHTWVIGVDARTQKVSQIRVVEMSCHHAYPTKEKSYLDQYVGKGPAEVAALDKDIVTIAKATGSSDLTTKAVQKAIKAATALKGKL